jgi:hypothetical protein
LSGETLSFWTMMNGIVGNPAPTPASIAGLAATSKDGVITDNGGVPEAGKVVGAASCGATGPFAFAVDQVLLPAKYAIRPVPPLPPFYNPTDDASSPVPIPASSKSSGDSGLSTGAIAGIAIGAIAGLALVCAALWKYKNGHKGGSPGCTGGFSCFGHPSWGGHHKMPWPPREFTNINAKPEYTKFWSGTKWTPFMNSNGDSIIPPGFSQFAEKELHSKSAGVYEFGLVHPDRSNMRPVVVYVGKAGGRDGVHGRHSTHINKFKARDSNIQAQLQHAFAQGCHLYRRFKTNKDLATGAESDGDRWATQLETRFLSFFDYAWNVEANTTEKKVGPRCLYIKPRRFLGIFPAGIAICDDSPKDARMPAQAPNPCCCFSLPETRQEPGYLPQHHVQHAHSQHHGHGHHQHQAHHHGGHPQHHGQHHPHQAHPHQAHPQHRNLHPRQHGHPHHQPHR